MKTIYTFFHHPKTDPNALILAIIIEQHIENTDGYIYNTFSIEMWSTVPNNSKSVVMCAKNY